MMARCSDLPELVEGGPYLSCPLTEEGAAFDKLRPVGHLFQGAAR